MKKIHEGRIKIMLKDFDDVFHVLLIAMERLEAYLEIEQKGIIPTSLKHTAIKSDRDIHNDEKNIPSRGSFLAEVQLDCSSLVFQPEEFDPETYKKTATFFLNDLLEWFAGRTNEMDFNEVDAFAIPILAILNRSVTDPTEVVGLVDKYITHIPTIHEKSEKEQEESTKKGLAAYLLGQHHASEQMSAFIASGADVELTVHQRGSVLDGYKRLFEAFTTLYTETLPAKTLIRTVKEFIPEVAEACPDICIDNVELYIAKHHENHKNDECDETTNVVVNNEDNSEQKVNDTEKTSIISTFVNLFK